MKVLCFDISTGGLSCATFDQNLTASNVAEIPWNIATGSDGSAVLSVETLENAFQECLSRSEPADAISFSCFMHSSLVLDGQDRPLTPVYTWMDRRGEDAVERLRKQFGADFHARTGCRFHPMFPVFKADSFRIAGAERMVSAKSFLIAKLTGNWVEDHGTASATGLYNVRKANWDDEIMDAVQLKPSMLTPLTERNAIVGYAKGIPVVAGSGDGFLANFGSGCDNPTRMASTLGTSASVRQVLSTPVLDEDAGAFCYRVNSNSFLLGCASSNGGNVLDLACSVLGTMPSTATDRTDLPTFIPLLNGERSPEWDPSLTASWHGLQSRHTAADLMWSVIDGVVFNLAHYVQIIQRASGVAPDEIVLSGNGFLNPAAQQTFAAAVDAKVIRPRNQGLASLRGAAACGLQALGVDPTDALEGIVADSEIIQPFARDRIRERFKRYLFERRGRVADL